MELTPHIQSQPQQQEEPSSEKKSSSFGATDVFGQQSSLSGGVKPRGSAMSSSSLHVQKKTTGTASASSSLGAKGKSSGSGTISKAVARGITSVVSKPVIVDNSSRPGSGQMTQTTFLAKLDQNIRAVADPLLKKKGTSTDQCPWLYWAFTYYEYMASASEIQTALNTYIPSTQAATSATDLINNVCAYVKKHVTVWVNTGKVTGVPKDVMANLSQLKKGGKMVQKKSADGSMEPANGAEQIHQQLEGSGQSLNGSLRSKMENALGTDLSGVKIHTGGEAGSIASSQNAKALTVGQHIAFGSGQYQPGTMHGDALIAHELAHTIQQKGAEQSVQSKDENQNSYDTLEHDADNTAVSAVSSIWGSTKEWMSGLGKKTGSALKSGLQLQKCVNDNKQTGKDVTPDSPAPTAQQQTQTTTTTTEPQDFVSIMGGLTNTPMTWVGSGRGSTVSRFAQWAKADNENGTYKYATLVNGVPAETQGTGAPTFDLGSSMNCWEMIMLAMYKAGTLTWAEIHALYTSTSNEATEWPNEVIALITKGKTKKEYKYKLIRDGIPDTEDADRMNVVPDTDQKAPARGAIVFFDDGSGMLAHVAVSRGTMIPTPNPMPSSANNQMSYYGSEIYSFWPKPFARADNFTKEPVYELTIEMLATIMRLGQVTGMDMKPDLVPKPLNISYYE